ncbi:MAG TPA: helix-turn-helix transcriptional regulator [Candidatus Limnocylindrales bacterium]|nr:helix-turn-helix transcriptional regulator [Candidatus Limnocylindrales bacterium]
MIVGMATRERPGDRGRRRTQDAVHRLAGDFAAARRTCGLSLREIGAATHTSHQQIHRFERGQLTHVDPGDLGAWCGVVGLDLAIRAFPAGDPVRDRAQLALLERFRAVLHPSLSWATEVPLPVAADLRAWDAVTGTGRWRAYIDAEMVLRDLQALDRRLTLKARDGAADLVILVVADTTRNRSVLRGAPSAFGQFSRRSRPVLAALRRGQRPPGHALLML